MRPRQNLPNRSCAISSDTRRDLAVHLGMDRSFLSDLERGKREPCLRTLEVIAQGFEVSVPQLLSRV